MSQRQALRDLDARILAALQPVGLVDTGTYTAPDVGAVPVACQVMVDRAAQFFDERTGVSGNRITVTLFLQEIPSPRRQAVVSVDDDVWTLEQLDARDESMSRWVVTGG